MWDSLFPEFLLSSSSCKYNNVVAALYGDVFLVHLVSGYLICSVH